MTLVDSTATPRQEAQTVPVTGPRQVQIGDGSLTTYTHGQDLYDAMLDAIEKAQRQILFETYIWKGDEVGERFKAALARGRPRRRGLRDLRRVRQPGRLAAVQAVPADDEGAALPRLPTAGWKFYDLARYGRDHRKILVVDDAVGFVGG